MPTVTPDKSEESLITASRQTTRKDDQEKARAIDMTHYDFTLKFALPQQDLDPEGFVEQLFADGCDDALIGIGQHGRLALDFTREASSAGEAVLSALTDVQRIVPGARLIEASPDFVGLTDIANILGFSRQNMRKLLVKSGPTFPLPVHDGKPAIWHLATILDWFAIEKGRDLDAALHEVSRVTMQCNLVKDSAGIDDSVRDRLKALVA